MEDEHEYEALINWEEWKTKLLREVTFSAPFRPPQITHEIPWKQKWTTTVATTIKP